MRRSKSFEKRVKVVSITVAGIGFSLAAMVCVIGFMVSNGRLHYDSLPIISPVPIQPRIAIDDRSPKQKTRVADIRIQCTPNPVGLVLTAQVQPLTITPSSPMSQTIQIEGKGFVPEETVNIFLKSTWQDGLYSLAFIEKVNTDASFSHRQEVMWERPQAQWQAFVVHQRGAACVSFLGN